MKDAENSKDVLELHEEDVRDYLAEKYGESFEIKKFVQEFNGDAGVYYRVVFQSDKYPEKGVLYCYADGFGTGENVTIGGTACVATDDYANVMVQSEYAAALQEQLGEDVLVKCRLETPNHQITGNDLSAGAEACLENADLRPHLFVFILADTAKRSGEFRTAAETLLGKYNVYKQYMYIGYQSRIDLEEWESRYYQNENSFEIYLVDESDIDIVDFSSFKLDEGLSKSIVVKE